MENLSPPLPTETRTLAAEEAPANARLSCVTKLLDGDVEVEVPDYSLEQPAA
jgi:ferredoxin